MDHKRVKPHQPRFNSTGVKFFGWCLFTGGDLGHSSVDVLHHVACSVATTGPRSRAPRGCWRRRSCHCTRSELRVRLVPAAALQPRSARPLDPCAIWAVSPSRGLRWAQRRSPRARFELRVRLVPAAALQRCGARPLHARTLAPAVPPRRRQRARRQRRPRRRARSKLRMRLVPEADLQVGTPRRVDDDAARRRRHPTSCAGRWRRSSRST